MKKIILPLVLSATTFVFGASLPSSIVGGGNILDDGAWYDITEAAPDNTRIDVNPGDSGNYAGYKTSNNTTINFTFSNNPDSSSANGAESITAYIGRADFSIKPIVHINYDYCKGYNEGRNFLIWYINNGSTLTLNGITTTLANVATDNYLQLASNDGTKGTVVYEGTSNSDDAVNKLNFMVNINGVNFKNNNALTVRTMKWQNGSTIDMGADFTVTNAIFVSGKQTNINLNGHNFTALVGASMEQTDAVLNIAFGEADADGSVFAFKGSGAGHASHLEKWTSMTFAFTDYDPLTDFIYFKDIPAGEDGVGGLKITGGDYAGQEFLTKVGEGEWAGWTQYYVEAIPEPSTYAIIFGLLSLGFATYRRRK